MKRNGVTVVELMVVVILLGVLLSFVYGSYSSYRNRASIMTDATNLRILAIAIRHQATETGTVAGSLSELTPENIERAYVEVLREGRPYTIVVHLERLWKEWWGLPTAEALVPAQYYSRQLKTIICPADTTPPTGFDGNWVPQGGVSYEMPPASANSPRGQSLSWLTAPANAMKVLLTETDSATGTPLVYRHKGVVAGSTRDVAVGIYVNGATFLEDPVGNQEGF